MGKGSRRDEPRNSKGRQRSGGMLPGDMLDHQPRIQADRKPFEPRTDAQASYANAIDVYDLIFAKGPTGTGKTHVAATLAAEALAAGDIKKIVVTRPSVEAEEDYGHLPGELNEKWEPFFKPVRAILEKKLGAGAVEMYLKNGKIEIAPLGFLRGATFDDCWVLFDEAQNATVNQMKLLLTRFGDNCKIIVDGDPAEQLDIARSESGFDDAWERMRGHQDVGFVEFGIDDIVRSGLARDILLRYRKDYSVGQAELGRFIGVPTP